MEQLRRIARMYYAGGRLFEYLAPALDLFLRVFIANVFFKSGLTKIQNWDSTLYLFTDEYQVPLLLPEIAAYLATGAELGLPVLLVLGLLGRFAALGLFILNGVAVISYYASLSETGLSHHLYWGILLTVLLVRGCGLWSLDVWIERRLKPSIA